MGAASSATSCASCSPAVTRVSADLVAAEGPCCFTVCGNGASTQATGQRKVSLGNLVTTNRGRLESRYDVNTAEPLGFGARSRVYRCTERQTGQQRAAKVISRKDVLSEDGFHEEVRIMQLLDHPNLVRVVETFEDDHHLCIVTELCEGGELFDFILDEAPLPEKVAGKLCAQMLRAVAYLHKNEIIHRDLKAENWLLASKCEPECALLKLADFGLARHLGPDEFATTKVGTPYYVAPEVIEEGSYGCQADLWSLGVVLHMMLAGSPPFTGTSGEVLKQICTRKIKVERLGKGLSKLVKELLERLLQQDPQKRPSALEALQHRWLQRHSADATSLTAKQALQLSGGRLKRYSEKARLVKASLGVVAAQLSREALDDLERAFMDMDANGDGTLSPEELERGLSAAGVHLQAGQASELLHHLDIDGSGAVDYSEFLAATVQQAKCQREEACRKAFLLFDLDHSGFIDRAELGKLLSTSSVASAWDLDGCDADDLDEIYAELDADGDGKIDFEEFMAMMNYHDKRGSRRARGGG